MPASASETENMNTKNKDLISSTILLLMDEKEVVTFIRDAQKGIYPPIDKDLLNDED